ncbi:probable chitinase 2 isoform X1 [Choristoneura fumiferana]|uniref:probable chitinase 2 isoform X1 n=2 Tax=Choristoneura fumiferana TaxID=7141 RepID=UPI003D15373C
MAGLFFTFFIAAAMTAVLDGQTLGGPMHGKVVVCYIASWATYRPEAGKYDIGDLEPSLCTHLVYSFAGLDEANMSIKSLDPWQDLEKNNGQVGYKGFVGLKQRYPHLKVTIAIGGWNEGSLKYSNMAAKKENREKFIKSVLAFLDNYKFDGLDLDWEYPARRDGKPEDRANYVTLVKELKEAFEPHNYILTAALGAGKDTMEAAYDLPKLSRYLDFIHMMCYDYHGTWDGVVGANAPLKGVDQDTLNVEFTIKYMLAHGVSPYKMVLGLPMYGRTFILQNPAEDKVEFGRTPVKNVGFKGPYTREAGFMGYNEICMELANQSHSWSHHWDHSSSTPYLRHNERVIVYDDAQSIAIKVKMAMSYGLGGLMVWSIDTDDFKGACAAPTNAYTTFTKTYGEIRDSPVLTEALKTLKLPDANRIENLSRRTAYVASNGKLFLRLPEPEYSNYALMRTINEATTLALEEKRIIDEMDRIMRENEIEHKPKPDSGSRAVSSMSLVLCLFLLFKLF